MNGQLASCIKKMISITMFLHCDGNHNTALMTTYFSAESFSGKGMCMKGMRRHARGRMGQVRYQYCHYFVRLEEGKPPKDYYKHDALAPEEQLDKWLEQMRKRKIINSY